MDDYEGQAEAEGQAQYEAEQAEAEQYAAEQEYLANQEQLVEENNMETKQTQYTGGAWCKRHTKSVGKDQWGNWYDKCYTGHTLSTQGIKAECEVIVEEGGE